MAMGKRKRHAKQASMWVATHDLPRSAAHPFYTRLNQILDQADFDGFVETRCQPFYADDGRPGLPPGRYFRMLLLGYFEGLDSERAIAWRAADSLSVRSFLRLELPEAPPDHSTVSRTRRLIDLETHQAIFAWVLQRLADAGLVKGKTIGVDATTLEANAALRSVVRRDTGESYEAFLTGLAQASGIVEHQLTMSELSFVKITTASGLLMSEWRRRSQRSHRLGHATRPGAIDFPAVTLEAERGSPPKLDERRRVVAIGTNLAAILEPGLPLPARRAQGPESLRLTVGFAARHRRPSDRFGPAPRFDWSQGIKAG